MDKILNTITRDKLLACLAGTPFDVSVLSGSQLSEAGILFAHCCLNGPVGVNKQTTFPGGQQGSIKSILNSPKLSNKSWQAACRLFAVELKNHYSDVCDQSQQTRMYGDIWPLRVVP